MICIIVIGSNCGKREDTIKNCLKRLEEICSIVCRSEIYESPDCLGSGKRYLNVVAKVQTCYEELELNNVFKAMEREAGRDGASRERGDVPLDIDIVTVDDRISRPSDYAASYFKKGFSQLFK